MFGMSGMEEKWYYHFFTVVVIIIVSAFTFQVRIYCYYYRQNYHRCESKT